jgi:hypothetical protein
MILFFVRSSLYGFFPVGIVSSALRASSGLEREDAGRDAVAASHLGGKMKGPGTMK